MPSGGPRPTNTIEDVDDAGPSARLPAALTFTKKDGQVDLPVRTGIVLQRLLRDLDYS
jgi:hypothetical protein